MKKKYSDAKFIGDRKKLTEIKKKFKIDKFNKILNSNIENFSHNLPQFTTLLISFTTTNHFEGCVCKFEGGIIN